MKFNNMAATAARLDVGDSGNAECIKKETFIRKGDDITRFSALVISQIVPTPFAFHHNLLIVGRNLVTIGKKSVGNYNKNYYWVLT